MLVRTILTCGVVLFLVSLVRAGSPEDIRKQYPADSYLIGVGEVQPSGDNYSDRRRAEILARLEIAKTIKVTIKETSTDIACERTGKAIFENKSECVNQFTMLVEESVNEALEGSKIVDAGEDKIRGVYYAVAIMQRTQAARMAEEGVTEANEKVKEHIENAKAAKDDMKKKEELHKARKELLKSIIYAGERSVIGHKYSPPLQGEGQGGDGLFPDDSMFEKLADEITKFEEGTQKK